MRPEERGTGASMSDGVPTAVTRLTSLRRGATGRVAGLDPVLAPAVRRRLADLGFVVDAEVRCLRRAPLGSPTVFRIGETDLCLRRSLSDQVLVAVPR